MSQRGWPPQALGWAAQENGKETRLWPIEWGSICCSSVRSPTPSHTQRFQIKWEVYFSKNCVACLYCVVLMILHAYIDIYVLCVCIVGHPHSLEVTGKAGEYTSQKYIEQNNKDKWLIDFNNMSTHLGLFYSKRFRNLIHYMFIFTFFGVVVA